MGRLDAVYARLPHWAQHGAVSLYGAYWYWLRFGPGYAGYVDEYRARDRWTWAQWQDWQQEQLAELLPLAAQRVPYYREHWNAEQKAAAAAGCLRDLPLLGKEPLRAAPTAFLREDEAAARNIVTATSGSTGTPLSRLLTVAEMRRVLAIREARSAGWAGVSFGQPRATFSGRMIEPDPASRGPFHRFNLVERQVYLSAFHLRPDTARQYLAALEQHGVRWLTGYAVSYSLLARMLIEQNLRATGVRAVITTSEKVTPEMRAVMETAYQCRVFEEYSSVENVMLATECEHGRLHVSPDAGVVELLREDGTPCAPGETGEVVVTGLMCKHQMLIRYRLGDVARWDAAACPCGRQMPVLQEVVGRIEDVVIGPDGRELVRFHGIFVNQPHVREGQIIQEALDRIRVKVVPVAGFNAADEADITARIQQRLGAQVAVIVEAVAEIPRTKAGKFQAVINRVTQAAQPRID